MNDLLNIIYYICKKYPIKEDLSNARLNKIIYLSDWRNVLKKGYQISNISWTFYHYGPYVNDIIDTVNQHANLFNVKCVLNAYGTPKQIISINNINDNDFTCNITDVDSIDFIIDKTKNMGFNQFIQYVYSTYPVLSSQHGDILNLTEKAKEYRLNKQSL